jgi:hypothetical protein
MSRYIVDDIGAVVAKMRGLNASSYGTGMATYLSDNGVSSANQVLAPFYMYGHRKEIANRLREQNVDKVLKYQKYPLIALRMDIPEPYVNGMAELSLNIVILAYTDKSWNAEERMTNVFKPVLYPIYDRFLYELRKSGLFFWQGDTVPEHTKVDRPFWGIESAEGNTKYIFSDPLDAIEIIDLKIKKNFKNC